jgi:hypothetical protein
MSRALPRQPLPDRAKRGQTPFGARPGSLAVAVAAVALAAACAGGGAASAPSHTRTVRPPASFAGAGPVVVRYLRRREPGVRLAHVRLHLTTLDSSARSETVLATVSARLGRRPGTTWVDLGQRALVLRRSGGRVRVAADLTRGGTYSLLQDGVAGMPPHSRFTTGRRVVVVSAPGVPVAEAAEVAAVADRALPGLLARYRLPGPPALPPVIFMTRSWAGASLVAGVPMPHESVGAEYQGLVYLKTSVWEKTPPVERDSVLVHELTHVASARLVAGCPLSLVEGVARYEEQQYVRAAGLGWPYRYLAAAYQRGYPSLARWRWTFGHWMLRRAAPTWLAYEDGAAIVRAVLGDGGDAGLHRLAAAFRRDGVAGRFSAAQVNRAFRAAVGRSFAAVAAQARAETIAAALG